MTHPINGDLECWRAPQSPFQILYSRLVLEQIRLAVVDAYFLVPRGGVEIGGVLLGTYRDRQVEVIDFKPFECEHAFGPSFSLSPRDEECLKGVLAEVRNKSDGLEPVGWYHSHTRSEIFLTEADLAIHDRYFPEMWQVALVVRPSTTEPTRAGFFFREPIGSIHSSASYREFQIEPLRGRPALGEDMSAARAWMISEEADVWDLLTAGNSAAADLVVAPPPESTPEPLFGSNPQAPQVSPVTYTAQPQPKLECQVTPVADSAAPLKRPAAITLDPQPSPEPLEASTLVRRMNSGSQVSTTGMAIGARGGSDFSLQRVLNRVFRCSHRYQSRPITPRGGGEAYAVCLDCGTRLAYDLKAMRVGTSVPGSSLDRRASEVGKEEVFDFPAQGLILGAPGRWVAMWNDSQRFHRQFGTTAVLWIGAMSLAAGLLYLPHRPASSKNLTAPAGPSLSAESLRSRPSFPVQENANFTVSTGAESTTDTKTIQPDSTSAPATPRSNVLRLKGNSSVIVLAREAKAALELSQHPERLGKLIRRGSLFTVPPGTGIKLLQGDRFVTKVRITEGAMAGQEGWAQPGQARLLSSPGLVNSSPSLPAQYRGTGVPLDPQGTKLVAKATDSTTTIGEKAIQADATSASAAPRSNPGPGRLSDNGSIIVLGREAVAAMELSQHPERLGKLIQNGSLFTVPLGTAIKLVQGNRLGNRLVVKVLIMNGAKVGQEGWAPTWPVSQ